MTRRARWAGVAAGVCLLGLATGCAHDPSVAFVVGGTTVTEQQVTEAAESCARSFRAAGASADLTADDVRSGILTNQIFGAVGAAIAQRTGTTVSEDERVAALNDLGDRGAVFTNDPLCREVALDVMAYSTLINDMSKTDPMAFANQVDALDITVNPRYGQVDRQGIATGGDAFTGSGSLSVLYAKP